MAQAHVSGLGRVAMRYVQDNEVAVNVFWVLSLVDDIDNITRATDFKNAFADIMDGTSGGATPVRGLKDLFSDAHTLVDITVTDFSTVGGASFVFGINHVGTASANSLPIQDAAVVTWYTNVNTRRGRGRNYIGGFTTDALSTDTAGSAPRLNSTTVVAMGHAMSDLLDRLTGFDAALVVNSVVGGTVPEVQSLKVGNVWRTQRRRANKLTSTQTVTS